MIVRAAHHDLLLDIANTGLSALSTLLSKR
jgi:hypothetical protein